MTNNHSPLIIGLEDGSLIELLSRGCVGVMPTDTVYGVVCSLKKVEDVKRFYTVKNRDTKPGTIIAADVDQVLELGISRDKLQTVNKYWPGPVSIIIDSPKKLKYLSLAQDSLAFRVPKNQKLHDLLKKTGPLITSSANPPGLEPAKTIEEAITYFGNKLDFYVDGGDLSNKKPSKIIKLEGKKEIILRP